MKTPLETALSSRNLLRERKSHLNAIYAQELTKAENENHHSILCVDNDLHMRFVDYSAKELIASIKEYRVEFPLLTFKTVGGFIMDNSFAGYNFPHN